MSTYTRILIELIRHGINDWKLYTRLYSLSKLTNELAHKLFEYKKKQTAIHIQNVYENYYIINKKKNGLYEARYDNGQLYIRCMLKNNKLDGLYEAWHENGKVAIKCTYKNAKRNGLYERWYKNGNQYIRCTYINNKLEGLYESWYENRYPQYKATYKNDLRDGICENWYDDDDENNHIMEAYKTGNLTCSCNII